MLGTIEGSGLSRKSRGNPNEEERQGAICDKENVCNG